MNVHLTDTEPVQVAPCATFTHVALDAVSRTLFALRKDKLQSIYVNAADKRALHFQSIKYKEELWDRAAPTDTMRDGKCVEASPRGRCPSSASLLLTPSSSSVVLTQAGLLYIHHLSQEQRQRLAKVDNFVLPLMPEDGASIEAQEAEFDGGSEYRRMTQCFRKGGHVN